MVTTTKKVNFRGIVQARLINLKAVARDRKDFILSDSLQATLDLVAKI